MLEEPDGGFAYLVKAIRSGELDSQLETWAPASYGQDYATILVCALSSNLEDVVQALLDRGADPNRGVVTDRPKKIKDKDYSPPFHDALHSEVLTRKLIEAGGDVNLLWYSKSVLRLAATQDSGVVRAVLEAGADPLINTNGITPMMVALDYGTDETVALIREAGWKVLKDKKATPYSCKAGKKAFNTAKDRGVSTFAKPWLDAEASWLVTIIKADLESASDALRRRYRGSELISNPKSHIMDKGRPVFVFGLEGMAWSIAVEDVGQRRDLSNIGNTSASSVSKKLGCDVISFDTWAALLYQNGKRVEKQDWDPYGFIESYPDGPTDKQLIAIEKKQLKAMDSWFKKQGVLLPAASYVRDGFTCKLELRGVKKSSVSGVNVIMVK